MEPTDPSSEAGGGPGLPWRTPSSALGIPRSFGHARSGSETGPESWTEDGATIERLRAKLTRAMPHLDESMNDGLVPPNGLRGFGTPQYACSPATTNGDLSGLSNMLANQGSINELDIHFNNTCDDHTSPEYDPDEADRIRYYLGSSPELDYCPQDYNSYAPTQPNEPQVVSQDPRSPPSESPNGTELSSLVNDLSQWSVSHSGRPGSGRGVSSERSCASASLNPNGGALGSARCRATSSEQETSYYSPPLIDRTPVDQSDLLGLIDRFTLDGSSSNVSDENPMFMPYIT